MESTQETVLRQLLTETESTRFGKKHGFKNIHDYRAFQNQVPLQTYDDIKSAISEMKSGQRDILWPGKVQKFAVSAGTTGEGKHLPLSEARLESDKRFMRKIALSYFKQRPNLIRLFGKHLSLPGTIEKHDSYQVGEVSGFSAKNAPLWLRPFQLENPEILTTMSFQEKFNLLLRASLDANIKVITAAPSWILTLFQQALNETGKSSIDQVWPELNLLICGGVKLDNYRSHLQKLIGNHSPDFIETYGASEGYFAYSDDLNLRDLSLVTDNGIFYEFIKDPKPEEESADLSNLEIIPLSKVEISVPYALVVTTNGGLWRYRVRDIIEFTSIDPPRILVKGRVSEMLDDFGEALYIYEAEDALQQSLREMDLQKSTFTIIPELSVETELPRHHWMVQFAEPLNDENLKKLAEKIDQKLRKINRHYAIRRESGSLGAPLVHEMSQEKINRWLKSVNRAGAQGKLPKIIRENIDVFL